MCVCMHACMCAYIPLFFFFFLSRIVNSMSLLQGASLVAQLVESACNAGDPGSIPGEGRSPGEGNGNPLQYSCLENPRDRRAGRFQSLRSQESDMI